MIYSINMLTYHGVKDTRIAIFAFSKMAFSMILTKRTSQSIPHYLLKLSVVPILISKNLIQRFQCHPLKFNVIQQ